VQEIGEISDFSSYGLDDNGKPRPTLLAPGMGIISAANNYDENLFLKGAPGTIDTEKDLEELCSLVEKHGRKNWYVLEQGTSMSTPVVTGIVALWMQAKPTLTVNEILDVMKNTCVNDEFTTNTAMIPSGNRLQAGLGKIDCLAGLKQILGTTDIESISMDGHREATPATMYSVDAPVYNMMGQRVDKSQKGLVIYKGRKYVNK
jgi:subtilisin family serine protease